MSDQDTVAVLTDVTADLIVSSEGPGDNKEPDELVPSTVTGEDQNDTVEVQDSVKKDAIVTDQVVSTKLSGCNQPCEINEAKLPDVAEGNTDKETEVERDHEEPATENTPENIPANEIAPENQEESMDTAESQPAQYYYWRYDMKGASPKYLITTKSTEFKNVGKKPAKFLKGCKWAPDGSCLLSCSDDDNLRLFNFPSCFAGTQDWTVDQEYASTEDGWSSELKVKEGGLIYDYCWYPLMSSMDPVSSCFISTSSEAPIHLWDAFTGKLRASYQPFNHLEQLVAAQSLAFDPSGELIYSGYEKKIRIFNITRPGKTCVERPLKQSHAELNQYGIVASLCVNPSLRSFYAVGTFDKTVGLYCDDGSVICLLQGHIGGVTHMKFSSDGMKLYTGGRNDSRLMCWDMRKMGEAFKIFDRVVTTHQRIYFDVTPDDSYLATGGTDGIVKMWDEKGEGTEPICQFTANTDCVNGVSFNPYVPILATSSGQRHFYELASDSDDEMFVKSESSRKRSCDIKLWKVT